MQKVVQFYNDNNKELNDLLAKGWWVRTISVCPIRLENGSTKFSPDVKYTMTTVVLNKGKENNLSKEKS